MSVLYCRTPHFLFNLACRSQPQLAAQPLALLGPDGRIWAVSPPAHQSGVRPEMRPRLAQTRCPDLQMAELDLPRCRDEQAAFLGTLSSWGLPVEEQGWGQAYLDLHGIAATAEAVGPLAAELGRQLRQALGQPLQPAIGWDSGKFTARAAAACTRAGRMRLVEKAEEKPFLKPLPTTLLPLPPQALQQLQWLGIRTLGQFADLPTIAVWQRFGPIGKLAQRWARGQDDRPVRATVDTAPKPIQIDLDPPTALLSPLLAALQTALSPSLQAMAARLEGCRRLRLRLYFLEGDSRHIDLSFVEALTQGPRLQAALTHHLQTIHWQGEACRVDATLLEKGELPSHQLRLLPEMSPSPEAPLASLVHTLAGRHGDLFFQGRVVDGQHPLPERRVTFVPAA